MAAKKRLVTGGVDTHKHTHHAAALDATGRLLGDAQFPTTAAGYAALLDWLRGFGRVQAVGVEGTGSYGAGLARYLTEQQITVMEVDRPDRKLRHRQGKSDPIDAIAAARAVLAGIATGVPKARTGRSRAIRALRVARVELDRRDGPRWSLRTVGSAIAGRGQRLLCARRVVERDGTGWDQQGRAGTGIAWESVRTGTGWYRLA